MTKRKIITINIVSFVIIIMVLVASQVDWGKVKPLISHDNKSRYSPINWSGMSTKGITSPIIEEK